jgi:hypothetical protein
MKGQCYCGKVRYEVTGPLKFVAHDHCAICRKISGAAFVTWAGVKEPQMELTDSESSLSVFRSTPDAERSFCSHCGSHLFFRSTRWPGEVHFTVSTLTDPLEHKPQANVFFTDRAPWIDGCESLPKYGGKSGTEPL